MFLASPAQAERVECYLSFDAGVAEGPCEMGRNSTGTYFTIAIQDEGLHLTVLVYRAPGVGVVSPSRGMAARATMWAEGLEKTIVEELGPVTPLDACWINERVRICAWPIGAERSSAPADQ